MYNFSVCREYNDSYCVGLLDQYEMLSEVVDICRGQFFGPGLYIVVLMMRLKVSETCRCQVSFLDGIVSDACIGMLIPALVTGMFLLLAGHNFSHAKPCHAHDLHVCFFLEFLLKSQLRTLASTAVSNFFLFPILFLLPEIDEQNK